MAPFNTHFLIAETIWPELAGPWQPDYDQFCFGCIAPDVDKLAPGLTQKDTHFFDRTGDYEGMASQRSAFFLARQADFLTQPFVHLPPKAQAFALGYLCHLCVDEVSKHLWRRETWLQFREVGPGPAFAALDELVRARIKNYPAITTGLCALKIVNIIPTIPQADLETFRRGACNFARATNAEEEYLALVDMFDRPTPRQRQERLASFRSHVALARQQVHFFNVETLLKAGLSHSRHRLADLIAGRVPEQGYPDLG